MHLPGPNETLDVQRQAEAPDPSLDTPLQWHDCPNCSGEGTTLRWTTTYAPGCAFGHDDVVEDRCRQCGGSGGWVVEADTGSQIWPTITEES